MVEMKPKPWMVLRPVMETETEANDGFEAGTEGGAQE